MNYFKLAILLLTVILIELQQAYSYGTEELDWLAFGDLRGNIETCGCDPRTDLGGIKRIASLISRERGLNPDILVLDLGNNLDQKEAIKSKYLAHGLSQIKPDASLVNQAELQTDPKTWGKRAFILGNLRQANNHSSMIQTHIVKGKVVIMGYHWDQGNSNILNPWNNKTANSFKIILDKFPSFKKVLLFSGPTKDLHKIAKTSWYDLIISSNTKHEDEKPGFEEKENPESLMRLKTPFVRMVPLGGVGVLRGGKLMQLEAPSIAKLLQTTQGSIPQDKETNTIGTFQSSISEDFSLRSIPVTWLDYRYEQESPLEKLMQEYNAETKDVFEKIARSRLKDLHNSPFAGASVCKTCHPGAYEKWKLSKHAHAHDILVNAKKDKDPECVSCHVLGFSEKGGFISLKETPQFAHVQCENCHGARKDHAANPSVKLPTHDPKLVCSSCHHIPHSSNFIYESYWKKIEHGKN